jgi:hypothetical protein
VVGSLGVILIGAITEQVVPGRRTQTFAGNPAEIWMLVKIKTAMTPVAGEPGMMSGQADAATSKIHPTVITTAAEAANVEVGDRSYVLGRRSGETLRASRATKSAGSPWRIATVQRGDPLKSLMAMTEAE